MLFTYQLCIGYDVLRTFLHNLHYNKTFSQSICYTIPLVLSYIFICRVRVLLKCNLLVVSLDVLPNSTRIFLPELEFIFVIFFCFSKLYIYRRISSLPNLKSTFLLIYFKLNNKKMVVKYELFTSSSVFGLVSKQLKQ